MKARWITANSEHIREELGWRQRDLNIGLLRWMREASCLSVVIGARVRMGAGGPSWSELVRRFLVIALEQVHEITQMVPTPDSTPNHVIMERQVIDLERFGDQSEKQARDILELIDSDKADTETLTEGAQLCYDLFGQHLFTHITGILYENDRRPGPIHRAIAELAQPQFGTRPGGHVSRLRRHHHLQFR